MACPSPNGLTIKEAASVDIVVNVGETVQQTITPTKAGTFKLICVPHEGLGMVGQVIVK
ncbi:MAG: plastocyanin/azurin family copper-binding protein [Chloroflexota bacterium]